MRKWKKVRLKMISNLYSVEWLSRLHISITLWVRSVKDKANMPNENGGVKTSRRWRRKGKRRVLKSHVRARTGQIRWIKVRRTKGRWAIDEQERKRASIWWKDGQTSEKRKEAPKPKCRADVSKSDPDERRGGEFEAKWHAIKTRLRLTLGEER